MFIGVWINVKVFNLIPLVHMSIFMPTANCFYYYRSIAELEVRDGDASRSSLLYIIVLAILGFFVSPYHVEYYSFKVCEIVLGF